MQLDDLKTSWKELDRRLDRLSRINFALLTDAQMRKARWRILPVSIGALINIAVGIWLAAGFARFWSAHLDTPSALVSGIALHAAAIGWIVVNAVQLVLAIRSNLARPVVEIQRNLALLKAWEVRSFYGVWLGTWILLPAVLVSAAMAIAGVDLWVAARDVVLINIIVCVALALASIAFHRAARRPGARLGDWLDRFLRNHSIESARRELDEIDRFARE